jgi:hypothetical protein
MAFLFILKISERPRVYIFHPNIEKDIVKETTVISKSLCGGFSLKGRDVSKRCDHRNRFPDVLNSEIQSHMASLHFQAK